MAKAKWPLLRRSSDLAPPLSGRPEAVAAEVIASPRGRAVAVFDALPPKDETDAKALLRVRAYAPEGSGFALLLEHRPARASFESLDASAGRIAVSDDGTVAFTFDEAIHVVRPGGVQHRIDAPGAFVFFDPIAPERVRVVVRRASSADGSTTEFIETYDSVTNTQLDAHPVGSSGGFAPQVDPETGDVLLFDGWYARADGAFVGVAHEHEGRVLRAGSTSLHLGHEVDDDATTLRRARDGSSLPVGRAFLDFRRADVWRARAPMLASTDGRWLLSCWNGNSVLFDAERLEPEPLGAVPPEHTLVGPHVVAVLDEHRAIASRFGLYQVDLRRREILGEGPVCLLGLAVTPERTITLHEDGLRSDGTLIWPIEEPALDGLRLSPNGKFAVVSGASAQAKFPLVVVDLEGKREVARVESVASVAWIDAEHLAIHGPAGLRVLHVERGGLTVVGELPQSACLGSDGASRFFAGTDTELIEYAVDGAVRRRFAVPKKLSGYTWPSELVVGADAVYVTARRRLFRWSDAGECTRLNALENAVGGPKGDPRFSDGNLRNVAVSADGRRLAVTVKTKHDVLAVVVCDPEGTIEGWSGPVFGRFCRHGERAFAGFRDGTLVVATEHGALMTFELPGA